MNRRARSGFGLVEVMVVLVVLAVMGSVVLAGTANNRRSARQATNSTQLRGIHQGCVIYAQGNKSWFPGLTAKGEPLPGAQVPWRVRDGRHTASRFAVLINANTFTPEYMINPADTTAAVFELRVDARQAVKKDLLTTDHLSYAALNFNGAMDKTNPRRAEWSETINTRAVALSDRNTGADAGQSVSSVWTEQNDGDWRGTMVRNDNSTRFETSQVAEGLQYGDAEVVARDNIFEAAGKSDALMTFYMDDRLKEEQAPRDRQLW